MKGSELKDSGYCRVSPIKGQDYLKKKKKRTKEKKKKERKSKTSEESLIETSGKNILKPDMVVVL